MSVIVDCMEAQLLSAAFFAGISLRFAMCRRCVFVIKSLMMSEFNGTEMLRDFFITYEMNL